VCTVNNILYQREIYPPESFRRVAKYGLAMFVTTDEGLAGYLANVLTQLHEWLSTGNVQKLVLVITGQETGETLERWVFDLHTDKSVGPNEVHAKSDKEIQSEIAAIQRQITASVTFLPLNDEPCAFDLLVYTDDDIAVPKAWEESDPRFIVNSDEVRRARARARANIYAVPRAQAKHTSTLREQASRARAPLPRACQVRLRSFTTSVHKVDSSVSYKADRD
jgi:mitotic spindle assembly checkpoint protein MAD2